MADEPDDSIKAGPKPTGSAARGAKTALDVLIVADDSDMRTYLRRCLAAHDRAVRVIETEDADSVIAWIRDHAPDLVIIDLDGAGRDGPASLRQALEPRGVPLLLLADEPAAAGARIPGARVDHEAVIAKPFNARRLCAELERLLPPGAAAKQLYDRA